MKKLAVLLAIVISGCPAWSQSTSQWSGSYYLGIKNQGAIVSYNIKTLDKVFGKPNWNLNIKAFSGLDIGSGSPFGGIDIDKSFNVASGVDAFLGLGLVIRQSKPSDVGIVAGLTFGL